MKKTLTLCTVLLLSACGSKSQQPSEKGRLFDTWHLTRMDGTTHKDIAMYQKYTLRIDKNKLSGAANNSFSVDARVNTDGTLQIGRNMRTTEMLSMGRARFLENQYFTIISSSNRWKKANGQLIITGRKGKLFFRQ